jgi:hypothetical protein
VIERVLLGQEIEIPEDTVVAYDDFPTWPGRRAERMSADSMSPTIWILRRIPRRRSALS